MIDDGVLDGAIDRTGSSCTGSVVLGVVVQVSGTPCGHVNPLGVVLRTTGTGGLNRNEQAVFAQQLDLNVSGGIGSVSLVNQTARVEINGGARLEVGRDLAIAAAVGQVDGERRTACGLRGRIQRGGRHGRQSDGKVFAGRGGDFTGLVGYQAVKCNGSVDRQGRSRQCRDGRRQNKLVHAHEKFPLWMVITEFAICSVKQVT